MFKDGVFEVLEAEEKRVDLTFYVSRFSTFQRSMI